jgi:hypothetical protein
MAVFHGLSEDGYLLLFACAIAFDLAPYGNSEPGPSKLRDLLRAPLLHCASYCVLATRLFRKARPKAAVDIRMAGWDEEDPHHPMVVGNHAQLFVEKVGVPLLLDPTVPLVAHTNYLDLKAGKPVGQVLVKVFGQRFDKIPEFRERVTSAVVGGKFKHAKVLYYQTETEFAPPET